MPDTPNGGESMLPAHARTRAPVHFVNASPPYVSDAASFGSPLAGTPRDEPEAVTYRRASEMTQEYPYAQQPAPWSGSAEAAQGDKSHRAAQAMLPGATGAHGSEASFLQGSARKLNKLVHLHSPKRKRSASGPSVSISRPNLPSYFTESRDTPSNRSTAPVGRVSKSVPPSPLRTPGKRSASPIGRRFDIVAARNSVLAAQRDQRSAVQDTGAPLRPGLPRTPPGTVANPSATAPTSRQSRGTSAGSRQSVPEVGSATQRIVERMIAYSRSVAGNTSSMASSIGAIPHQNLPREMPSLRPPAKLRSSPHLIPEPQMPQDGRLISNIGMHDDLLRHRARRDRPMHTAPQAPQDEPNKTDIARASTGPVPPFGRTSFHEGLVGTGSGSFSGQLNSTRLPRLETEQRLRHASPDTGSHFNHDRHVESGVANNATAASFGASRSVIATPVSTSTNIQSRRSGLQTPASTGGAPTPSTHGSIPAPTVGSITAYDISETHPRPATSEINSTTSSGVPISRRPWHESEWRHFSEAMRASLSHQGLSPRDAVTMFNEIREHLPPEMNELQLGEVVLRLNAWVHNTEKLRKQRT